MVQCKRLCGLPAGSVGLLAVILYLVDKSLAALDGYVPGEDYPVYDEVPKGLSFTCDDKLPGYYADPETQCQAWHWCVPGIGGNIMYSFLCGPGTVFNQRTRVCDWFFKVDCPSAQAFYGINEDLYKDDAGNYIAGKKKKSNWDQRRLLSNQRRSRRQDFSIVPLTDETKTNHTDTDDTNTNGTKTRRLRRQDTSTTDVIHDTKNTTDVKKTDMVEAADDVNTEVDVFNTNDVETELNVTNATESVSKDEGPKIEETKAKKNKGAKRGHKRHRGKGKKTKLMKRTDKGLSNYRY